MSELVVRGERVLIDGVLRSAAIQIRDGRNVATGEPSDVGSGIAVHDAGSDVVMAGLVDTHVHVNEPGRAEWEGFETATRAAAAGGVTTILDMPLNSIPATTTVDALEQKRAIARARCHVDVGFIGGVVPGNAAALVPLADAGVLAFKCFLIDPGVKEFAHVDETQLRESMPIVASLGRVLMAHAELPAPIARAVTALDPSAHRTAVGTAARDVARLQLANVSIRPAHQAASSIAYSTRRRSATWTARFSSAVCSAAMVAYSELTTSMPASEPAVASTTIRPVERSTS